MGAVSRPPSPAPRSSAPPCTCTLHLLRSSFGNAFLIFLACFRVPFAYTFSFSFFLSRLFPFSSRIHIRFLSLCLSVLLVLRVCTAIVPSTAFRPFVPSLFLFVSLIAYNPCLASAVLARSRRPMYLPLVLEPYTRPSLRLSLVRHYLNSFIVLTPYTPTLSLPFVPYSCLLLIPGTHPWLRSLDSPKGVSRTCPLHVLRSRS